MAATHAPVFDDIAPVPPPSPAVSWAAIFAGAAGAAALSLILLILGMGLGLSSVSPWVERGASAAALGVGAVVWICFTQVIASGLGGYLAGRLRVRWWGTQVDEVYFRDTAHGFLAWAVASLATAALLTSAIGSIVGGGVQAGATVAAGGAAAAGALAPQAVEKAAGEGGDIAYFIDGLFRRGTNTAPASAAAPAPSAPAPAATDPSGPAASTATPPSGTASQGLTDPGVTPAPTARVSPVPLPPPARSPEATTAEATAIFLNGLKAGALPAEDAAYLGQQVAERTGMPAADAQKRVTDAFARVQIQAREAEATARAAADEARKASAKGALWMFVSLLIGAFVASLAATFGGRQRDAV